MQRKRALSRWSLWIAVSLSVSALLPASELTVRPASDVAVGDVSVSDYNATSTIEAQQTPDRPIASESVWPASPSPTFYSGADGYSSDTLKISIERVDKYKQYYYVLDIVIKDAAQFKTAFAQGKYGKSYREHTSKMAKDAKAILAVNGDYYGFRDEGVIIRNNVLYRNKPTKRDMLIVDKNGDLKIINEKDADPNKEIADGALHSFCFGPALVVDSKAAQLPDKFIISTKAYEPRTAIGQVGPLHYKIVVVDGRSAGHSIGMTLSELADVFIGLGCKTAYNLDGGGSSTLYYSGDVINELPGGGERSVSDILYFAS